MKIDLKERIAEGVGQVQCNISSIPFKGEDKPDDEMVAINKHSLVTLSDKDVFIFEAELSNSNVDAYFTRMTLESLQNYANRINDYGSPLLAAHDSYSWAVGRIYKADVIKTDDGVNRLMIRSYIVRDDETSDISSQSLIRKIETGVQKDMSIGFMPGGYTCSIDGKPMVSGWFSRAIGIECEHIPGVQYDGQMCYAWVENGMILEGSLVYTGATPEAFIKKALNFLGSGKLSAGMVNSINKALNTNLLALKKENESNNQKGDNDMKAKQLLTSVANKVESETLKNTLNAKAEELGDEAVTDESVVNFLADEVQKLEVEKNELQKDADYGKTYRNGLIDKAHEAGVKALGNDYDKDAMQTTLENATIEKIQNITKQYDKIVEKLGDTNNAETDKPEDLEKETPKAGEETTEQNGGKPLFVNEYK